MHGSDLHRLQDFLNSLAASAHFVCQEDPAVYCLPASCGSGTCRIWPISDSTALILADLTWNDRFRFVFPENTYIYISYYFSLSAVYHVPGSSPQELHPDTLYTSFEQIPESCTVFEKGKPVRGLILLLSPKTYISRLNSRFSLDMETYIRQIQALDGLKILPEISVIYRQILEFKGQGLMRTLYLESKFNEILSLYLTRVQEETNSGRGSITEKQFQIKEEDLRQIQELTDYLHAHLADPGTMPLLARKACMSQAKLKYCFKQVTGMSLSSYLSLLRMNRARELLLTTDLSIREIASQIGYKKDSSFTSAFKKTEGCTPGRYRQMMRGVV